MGEEMSNTLNQDLNFDPNPEVDLESQSANETPLPAAEGSNGTKVKEEESDGSFFDCALCLDMSKEPVVTNCGHLYCWSCLYQWIQVSLPKQCLCPVCKGKISVETLTPIYGTRGRCKRKSEEVSNTMMIPSRPQAPCVESSGTTLQSSNDYIPPQAWRVESSRTTLQSSNDYIPPQALRVESSRTTLQSSNDYIPPQALRVESSRTTLQSSNDYIPPQVYRVGCVRRLSSKTLSVGARRRNQNVNPPGSTRLNGTLATHCSRDSGDHSPFQS